MAMPRTWRLRSTRTFLPLEKESTREQIIEELRKSGAEFMVNYLPVGSEEATRFYAACALEAGVGFVNNIPVFIASDPAWAKRFADKNLPIVGDDIKAQLGATVFHRTLVDLFRKRGVKVERTYQLNTGGNTDFLNMLDRSRLPRRKRPRPRRCSRSSANAWRTRTSTSARATTCPGRTTTRSVSSGSKEAFRRCADGARPQAFGGGLAELGRRGDRRHSLLQTCARSRQRWRAAFALRLFFEASAGANHRRRGVSQRRTNLFAGTRDIARDSLTAGEIVLTPTSVPPSSSARGVAQKKRPGGREIIIAASTGKPASFH